MFFHLSIRNSLRVIQKAEGGKRTFHFSFSGEEKEELREKDFRARVLAHFPGKINAQKSRSTGH